MVIFVRKLYWKALTKKRTIEERKNNIDHTIKVDFIYFYITAHAVEFEHMLVACTEGIPIP